MKNLLITGANGFIGSNFIKQFENKYKITKITRESKYDILDLNKLLEINNIDILLHFAAKTFVPDSFDNPFDFYEFNLNSTLNIAEYCRLKKVKRVIYLNSYSYGEPEYLPIDEKHPLSFHSPYNKSKYLAEELLFNYLENITEVVSLRLFNIYGHAQGDNFLIPIILKQLNSGKITLKDLKPKRDFLYINDLIDLLDLVISRDAVSGVFNVGSGESHSVQEIIDLIQDILVIDLEVESQNLRRENEVMNCIANIKKLKKDLHWIPTYTLKEGLKDYIQKEGNNVSI